MAKLAKLDVKGTENLKSDIDEIIQMAEVLKNIEVKDYIPEEKGILRRDAIEPSFEREDILRNASKTADGFIIVPKVVGE